MSDQPARHTVHNHGFEEGRGLACRERRPPNGSLRGQCFTEDEAEQKAILTSPSPAPSTDGVSDAVVEQAAREYSGAPFPSTSSVSRMRRAARAIWGAAQQRMLERVRAEILDVTVFIGGIEYVEARTIRDDLDRLAEGGGATPRPLSADRMRAVLRLIGPDDITPLAERMILKVWDAETARDSRTRSTAEMNEPR